MIAQLSLEAEKTWLQCECARWHMKYNLEGISYKNIYTLYIYE